MKINIFSSDIVFMLFQVFLLNIINGLILTKYMLKVKFDNSSQTLCLRENVMLVCPCAEITLTEPQGNQKL